MKSHASRRPSAPPGFSLRSLLAPAIVAVPVAVIVWWVWPDAKPPAPASVAAAPAAPVVQRPVSPFEPGAPVLGPDRGAEIDADPSLVRPPSLSEAEWQELQRVFARFPQRDAELAHGAHSLAFQVLRKRFNDLKAAQVAGSAPTPQLQATARLLDQALPAQLARAEIDFNSAASLKAAVLEVLVPDPTRRAAQLASWRDPRNAASPLPQAVAPVSATEQAAREAEFQRLKAQAVAAWNSLPPDQRDPADLEAEIADLRDAIFYDNN